MLRTKISNVKTLVFFLALFLFSSVGWIFTYINFNTLSVTEKFIFISICSLFSALCLYMVVLASVRLIKQLMSK